MIKTKEGNTEVRGTLPTVMTDFAVIAEAMHDVLIKAGYDDEFARQHIRDNVEMVFAKMDGKFAEFATEKLLRAIDRLHKEIDKE